MNVMFPRDSKRTAPGATSRRRWWLVGGVAVAALGLALGWQWLAAAGLLLPLAFLALLAPCMFMCVKGMGTHRTGSACSSHKPESGSDPEQAGPPQRPDQM